MKITSIPNRHFKAVQDSGSSHSVPLTAFVGYNGTGKSSVLEACEFLQSYALGGIEAALTPWYSYDSILWQGAAREKSGQSAFYTLPLEIELAGKAGKVPWKANLEIAELAGETSGQAARSIVPKREFLKVGKQEAEFRFEQRDRGRPRSGSQVLDANPAVNFRTGCSSA